MITATHGLARATAGLSERGPAVAIFRIPSRPLVAVGARLPSELWAAGHSFIASVNRLEGFKMLVLSRKKAQRIDFYHAGERISVTVTNISGQRVSLGLEAPGECQIVRGEVTPRDHQWPLGEQPKASGGSND